jgi:two-component sensor histidine kinase
MGDRIHVSGDVAVLSEERALPVVLGLHELCTNAIKYGSLSSATGSVTITCSADQQGNIARIVWQEAGGPLVETPKRVGFGTRLLTRLLAQEFGGKVQIEFAPDGVRCAIEMAMPKTRARTAKHTPVAGRDMVGKVMGARGRD